MKLVKVSIDAARSNESWKVNSELARQHKKIQYGKNKYGTDFFIDYFSQLSILIIVEKHCLALNNLWA